MVTTSIKSSRHFLNNERNYRIGTNRTCEPHFLHASALWLRIQNPDVHWQLGPA